MNMAYAIMTDDSVLRQETLKQIVDSLVEPNDVVFDVKHIKAAEATAFDIITSLESWPIGKCRVVIVHDTQRLPQKESEALAKSLDDLPESSCLVLLVDAGDADGRFSTELKTEITKRKGIYQLGGATKKDKIDVASKLVRKCFTDAGIVVAPSLVVEIVDRLGTDSARLRAETTKLIDYVLTPEGARELTEDDLDKVMLTETEDVSFKLIDSIIAGNLSEALRMIHHRMAHTKEYPANEAFKLIGLLRRQLVLVWQTKTLYTAGVDISKTSVIPESLLPLLANGKLSIADTVGKYAWMGRRLVSQARGLSWADLERGFAMLEMMTERLKSIDKVFDDPELVLSLGVMKMCLKKGADQSCGNPSRSAVAEGPDSAYTTTTYNWTHTSAPNAAAAVR